MPTSEEGAARNPDTTPVVPVAAVAAVGAAAAAAQLALQTPSATAAQLKTNWAAKLVLEEATLEALTALGSKWTYRSVPALAMR